ncbi:MAG: glycoside hydrolase family 2 protein [Bacteroidales bacterium]|nr:glycoside hydrolase family 2 protein [Bacteroidales bacterium]
MKCRFLFLFVFISAISFGKVQSLPSRIDQNFDKGWRFSLNANSEASKTSFDDSAWRLLNLPHDWAIEGSFSKDNPSGTGGGALPGGIGWYRKTFKIGNWSSSKHYFIHFDGVYMNSEVFINGHSFGVRPYGYISFEYDLTPYLNKNGSRNVIAVKVDNEHQPNSRWYSGCGIYRHVHLIEVGDLHVAQWGTQITASDVMKDKALLNIRVTVKNEKNSTVETVVKNEIIDPQGRKVGSCESRIAIKGTTQEVNTQSCYIKKPQLWNIDKPNLYKVHTYLKEENKIVDEYITSIGLRDFYFDVTKGFFLNGKNMKINGVCQHHDLGCLGAALNDVALHRQLKILKDMGCNAIRCSHNPPAPELLNMCDSMGLVVLDEAFDMWHRKKTAYDYANYFDKWYKKDLTDMVVRDRNHPCIILWSIGNEVLEQWNDANADSLSLEQANMILNFGHKIMDGAKDGKKNVSSLLTIQLADIVRSLDDRPITSACNEPSPNNNLFLANTLDVIGFNYHNQNIPSVPKDFPGKPFIITESVSALQTRGYYQMPSDSIIICPERWDKPYINPSFSCSAYDNCHVPWGSTHEETWDMVKHLPFVSGQFIWTGFDYIGEPTPYDWPARSSYFGIVDLAGFPKDSYYMYQSEWTKKPVLHLFPHWNWTIGQKIDMWAYYNDADEVELFINGKSQGRRHKSDHQYHVSWHCIYEPGTVRVVAYQKGKPVRQESIKTASAPAAIRLVPDKKVVRSDGTDLCFVTVEIIDKDGNLCPNADNLVQFRVNDKAFIAGVDNGNEISLERFKDNKRKAFYGKCLVVLQNKGIQGTIELTAFGEGLAKGSLKVVVR